jgi:hypothetical protein
LVYAHKAAMTYVVQDDVLSCGRGLLRGKKVANGFELIAGWELTVEKIQKVYGR